MSTHRINRVEIELEIDEVARARELIERVSRLHEGRIAPLLDRVLGDVGGPPERLERLERLEVELGELEADAFDRRFFERLEAELRAALRAALGSRSSGGDATLESAVELVRIFAWTGNLPWYADTRAGDPVSASCERLRRDAPQRLGALLREVAASPTALRRVLALFDPVALAELSSDTSGVSPTVVVEAIAAVGHRGPAGTGSTAASHRRTRAEGASEAPPEERPERRERGEVPPAVAVAERRADATSARGPSPAEAPTPTRASWTRADAMSGAWDFGARSSLEGLVLGSRPRPSAQHAETTSTKAPLPAAREPRASPPSRARADALAQLDELAVTDAGLVLLWPFLGRFFARTGLLDEEQRFVDDAAAALAPVLLERIVHDEPDPPPEWQLPLAKLLCGLAPTDPWELDRPPTRDQVDECEHLLAAVIEHAPILRAMPPQSFRETFLQRAGVLGVDNGAWVLRVERRPHDLVLDRFGWSWAWVKLPWMPDPLQVEW